MRAYKYLPRCLAVLSVLTFGSSARCLAVQAVVGDLIPSTAFVQAGIGDQSTRAYIGGLTWDWNWRQHYGFGTLSGYFDADFGRWTTDRNGVKGYAWMTQVGLTPVLRFRPTGAAAVWFAEIGVGANYILPLYRSGSKRFSSEFKSRPPGGIGPGRLRRRDRAFLPSQLRRPEPDDPLSQELHDRRRPAPDRAFRSRGREPRHS